MVDLCLCIKFRLKQARCNYFRLGGEVSSIHNSDKGRADFFCVTLKFIVPMTAALEDVLDQTLNVVIESLTRIPNSCWEGTLSTGRETSIRYRKPISRWIPVREARSLSKTTTPISSLTKKLKLAIPIKARSIKLLSLRLHKQTGI